MDPIVTHLYNLALGRVLQITAGEHAQQQQQQQNVQDQHYDIELECRLGVLRTRPLGGGGKRGNGAFPRVSGDIYPILSPAVVSTTPSVAEHLAVGVFFDAAVPANVFDYVKQKLTEDEDLLSCKDTDTTDFCYRDGRRVTRDNKTQRFDADACSHKDKSTKADVYTGMNGVFDVRMGVAVETSSGKKDQLKQIAQLRLEDGFTISRRKQRTSIVMSGHFPPHDGCTLSRNVQLDFTVVDQTSFPSQSKQSICEIEIEVRAAAFRRLVLEPAQKQRDDADSGCAAPDDAPCWRSNLMQLCRELVAATWCVDAMLREGKKHTRSMAGHLQQPPHDSLGNQAKRVKY